MTERRLKQIAKITVSNVDKKSTEGEQEVRLCNYTDVYYHDRITSDMDFMSATATTDQIRQFRLRPGDVIVTKDSETPDDIGIPALVVESAPDLICGYHLAVIRPSAEVDGRYLFWALVGSWSRSQLSAASTGVTRFGLRYDSIGDLRLTVPELSEQKAIAHYLDAEVARIDALIERKRRTVQFLLERWQSTLAKTFDSADGVPLKRLLRSRPAYGVLVPDHDPDGVPMLRIMDLKDEAVDLSSVARISPALSAQYRRTVLEVGDVVVSVVGTLGRSIEVTPALSGCNINRPLARVQLLPDVPRSLIRYWFGSPNFQRMAQMATSSDSAQPTLGMEDLSNLAVAIPDDRAAWGKLARQLEERERRVTTVLERLAKQILLLTEHRQALVTAAVTGQLDIPEVAA